MGTGFRAEGVTSDFTLLRCHQIAIRGVDVFLSDRAAGADVPAGRHAVHQEATMAARNRGVAGLEILSSFLLL